MIGAKVAVNLGGHNTLNIIGQCLKGHLRAVNPRRNIARQRHADRFGAMLMPAPSS